MPSSSQAKPPDSSGILDMDVPATPSPPRKFHNSSMKTGTFSMLKRKPFENKLLANIREEYRPQANQSMFASPSIMMNSSSGGRESHSSIVLDSSDESVKQPDPVGLIDLDTIFDELKNTQDPPGTIIEDPNVTEPMQIDASADAQKVVEIGEKVGNGSDHESSIFPPIQRLDWSGLNVEALKNLNQSAASFRTIIEELQKAK